MEKGFATGIAMLTDSVIAGGLWDMFDPAATFLAGAAFTLAPWPASGRPVGGSPAMRLVVR